MRTRSYSVCHAVAACQSEREHRRAKTDRLDTELLNVPFSAGYAANGLTADGAIPTMADEDAKRPHRERENLVGEQSRIVNPYEGDINPARHPTASIPS